jgi:hypothetical protein
MIDFADGHPLVIENLGLINLLISENHGYGKTKLLRHIHMESRPRIKYFSAPYLDTMLVSVISQIEYSTVSSDVLNGYIDRVGQLFDLKIPLTETLHQWQRSTDFVNLRVCKVLLMIIRLVNSRDGTIIVDEIDYGLHYRSQLALWELIYELALIYNVQVIASTMNKDSRMAMLATGLNDPMTDAKYIMLRYSSTESNYGSPIARTYPLPAFDCLLKVLASDRNFT